MAKKAVATLVVVTLVVVAAMSAGVASAKKNNCDAEELRVCLPTILHGLPPKSSCCSNLHAQEDCLCKYVRDPDHRKYATSPHARHMLKECNIAVPNC